jgi:hypothetical protein
LGKTQHLRLCCQQTKTHGIDVGNDKAGSRRYEH